MKAWISLAVAALIVTGGCRKKESAGPQNPPGEKPVVTAASPGEAASASGVEVGAMMPPYTAKNLNGSNFDLAAEKGNVVMLNIWATWCPPCRAEIPELQKIHDRYASRNFKVVGVSVDEVGTDEVKKFIADQKMTYPIAIDPEGRIANLLQTSVLPTTVVLDRTGKIVWKKLGMIDPSDSALTAAIEKALGS